MSATPVRPKDRFLVFGSPLIREEDIEEVVGSLRSGWLGTGPKVAAFEQSFREYLGSPHALAVNSCTAALHLAMVAANIAPGDEVITTPLTFCATVNAIIHAGGTPVLADVDQATMNIDPECIRQAITPRTRAIIPVHFAGRPCDMDAIMAIAREHGLMVIEDCAHSIEAMYKGRHTGTFGDFGCFSFYVTKNVVTGEGGMVVTADPDSASRIKVLALHGLSSDAWKRFSDEGYRHYLVTEAGFKYNMMDIQASLGLHQLARVERTHARREELWSFYDSELADLPLDLPAPAEPDTVHARHLYTVLLRQDQAGIDRDRLLREMTFHNIGVGVHYLSLPEHPYYCERFGWRAEEYPVAMDIGRRTMSLPLSPKLTDEDAGDVILALRTILAS